MKKELFFLAIIVFFFLQCGCGNDPLSPDEHQASYIDEPILIESSEFISSDSSWPGEYIFDLKNVCLVTYGHYNDFELSYWTSSSLDEDVWVYNFKRLTWDQIGFSPPSGILGLMVITQHSHLFSARGLQERDYLNDNLEMKIRGYYIDALQVRALRINPDYYAVPVHIGWDSCDGLTYDGDSFWISSNLSDRIYNLSLKGKILRKFEAPSGYPFGMAFDGLNLWLADGSNRIFALNRDGEVQGQFTVPTDYPGGLTWGRGQLWLSEYERLFGICSIFCIDPDAACEAGSAVIKDSFQSPGGGIPGLAFDGTHLLVVTRNIYGESDKLHKIATSGEVIQTYELPVKYVLDIAWDEEAVLLLNWGPKDLMSCDPVITKFKLRQ